MTAVYPRFLGVDGSGDFVWELETGRWTWGDSPRDAAFRGRTFEPARYIEKYGRPIPFVRIEEETGKAIMADTIDRKAEADLDPVELARQYAPPVTDETDRKALVSSVLYAFLVNLDGWIEGARSNHDALGHRDEPMQDECWTRWHPADIRSMVSDVAHEFGVGEFPKPEHPKEAKTDAAS